MFFVCVNEFIIEVLKCFLLDVIEIFFCKMNNCNYKVKILIVINCLRRDCWLMVVGDWL